MAILGICPNYDDLGSVPKLAYADALYLAYSAVHGAVYRGET